MIYTITSILKSDHGGRTKSLLSRIKFLDEELNITSKILTTNYNANYQEVYQKFLEEGKVTANTEYENIYDWLSGYKVLNTVKSKFLKKEKINETPYEIKGLTAKVAKESNIIRYYDGKTYVLYRRFYPNTKILEFEDFMSPISKRKIERWQYNKNGILHRKIYYSHTNFHRLVEEYFDTEGNIYCKKLFENNDENKLIYIQTYKNNRPFMTFSSEKKLFEYYFEQRFKEKDIVFCDARLLDAPLLKQSKPTHNILVFHSSHLNGKNIKGSYKYALENYDEVSKYIVLTHQQKEDIQNVTSIDSKKFAIIPHFINNEHSLKENIHKEDRFLFMGRLSPEKQIDHIIKAYKQFLNQDYNTELHIFGQDEQNQKEILEQLIKEYNLSDKVKIKDHTSEPLIEFQKSRASLLTSKFKGFGLSVMESIEMNCPVISYDVRYGPSEIIEHGKNGYLVEENNITEFANYMKKIVDEPLENVKTKPELTYGAAIQNYKQLFEEIEKYR
nr:glycosyltransferase [Staphylococcus sp. NRL 22/194]